MEEGTCNVVCFNLLKHIESDRASGGLIRSSGVSLFLDLWLLVLLIFSVGFSQAGFVFSLQ